MESKEEATSQSLTINTNDQPITQTKDDKNESLMSKQELMKAVEAVERDSIAIANSYSSLFASLRSALSQVTSSSVDHVQCFSDAAGRLQESALDSATKGNLYINSCLSSRKRSPNIVRAIKLGLMRKFNPETLVTWVRDTNLCKCNVLKQQEAKLNEEMRGIDTLAMQLKVLRRNVDALDTAVNSLVRLP